LNILEQRVDKAQMGEVVQLNDITVPFMYVCFEMGIRCFTWRLWHRKDIKDTYSKKFPTLELCKRNFIQKYGNFYIGA